MKKEYTEWCPKLPMSLCSRLHQNCVNIFRPTPKRILWLYDTLLLAWWDTFLSTVCSLLVSRNWNCITTFHISANTQGNQVLLHNCQTWLLHFQRPNSAILFTIFLHNLLNWINTKCKGFWLVLRVNYLTDFLVLHNSSYGPKVIFACLPIPI